MSETFILYYSNRGSINALEYSLYSTIFYTIPYDGAYESRRVISDWRVV